MEYLIHHCVLLTVVWRGARPLRVWVLHCLQCGDQIVDSNKIHNNAYLSGHTASLVCCPCCIYVLVGLRVAIKLSHDI